MAAKLNVFLRVCIVHFIIGLFTPALAGSLTGNLAAGEADGIVGAVCIIRHDNQMIMLSEVITKKIALPGGYIDTGNTAKQAAAREALEETGIVVKVGDLLQYRGRAAIFSCVAESPILVSSFKDYTGHPIVASWFSKHFATEIERVYLIDPDDIEPKDYRYHDDATLLQGWLERTPESEIQFYEDLSGQVSAIHQYELQLIQHFQQAVKAMPEAYQAVFDGVMYLVNLPGEPWLIAVLVVIVAGIYGPQALVRLTVLLLVSVFTTSLIKLGVASPRPSYILPELQQINAYGFGFPSTHTLLATVLWGSCWHMVSQRSDHIVKWLSLPLFLLLTVGQAAARVWYGVHFISDTLGSILLGLTILMALRGWCSSERWSFQTCIVSKWFWLLVATVVGVTASFTLAPIHVYIFAILLGIFISIGIVPSSPVDVSFRARLVATSVICVGLAVISYGVEVLAGQSTVSLIVLAIRGVGWAIAAIWLLVGSSVIRGRLAIGHNN